MILIEEDLVVFVHLLNYYIKEKLNIFKDIRLKMNMFSLYL